MFELLNKTFLYFKSLKSKLTQPEVLYDPKEYAKISNENADLLENAGFYEDYVNSTQELADNTEMLELEEDTEMLEFSKEESSWW